VRGNHDDIFDLILHSQSFSSSPDGIDSLAAFTWFMQFGLDQNIDVEEQQVQAAINSGSTRCCSIVNPFALVR